MDEMQCQRRRLHIKLEVHEGGDQMTERWFEIKRKTEDCRHRFDEREEHLKCAG